MATSVTSRVHAPSPFTPSVFVEQVTAAVLPLVDEGDGTELRAGKTRADAIEALLPLFGHYAVEDAVYAHRMLRGADCHWSEPANRDDPRAHAIYEAREALVHFICHAMSTGPACAAARAAFAQDGDGDGDELPEELYNKLHFHISCDVVALRTAYIYRDRMFVFYSAD
jgi:hypothetical protein